MDADVIGGTINFELREAKVKEAGKPDYDLLIQSAYNNLSNVKNKTNNYKYVGSVEDRFFDDRFGRFCSTRYEKEKI